MYTSIYKEYDVMCIILSIDMYILYDGNLCILSMYVYSDIM